MQFCAYWYLCPFIQYHTPPTLRHGRTPFKTIFCNRGNAVYYLSTAASLTSAESATSRNCRHVRPQRVGIIASVNSRFLGMVRCCKVEGNTRCMHLSVRGRKRGRGSPSLGMCCKAANVQQSMGRMSEPQDCMLRLLKLH